MNLRGKIIDAMFAHRVAHHVELLSSGHERVDKGHLVVRMHIVIVAAEDDEQRSVQIAGTLYQRCLVVALGIVLLQLDQRLRPLRIVIVPVGDRRAGNPRLEFLLARHQVQRIRASAAPAINADPVAVYPGLLLQPLHAGNQIVRL